MNEFLIELQAKLDEAKSKGLINSDIDKIQGQINKLKVQAEIDPNTISKLVKQLEGVINQKITISNINVDTSQAVKNAQSTGQQIGHQMGNAINQGVNGSLLRDKGKNPFKETFKQSADAAKDAQSYFEKLLKSENAFVTTMERFDDSKLNSFVVNIKRANGEVESLNYQLRNVGTKDAPDMRFQFTGGKTNDSGIIKQIQQIENAFANYIQKLEQFKSTNNNILSGLSTPLSDFENKLLGLKNGTVSIDALKNSFSMLNAEASKIMSNLSGQLSKTDAAIRNISKGEETISGLQAEFKGLSNTPKEINSELNKLSVGLQNIKKLEAEEGRTENWSKAYRDWEIAVDSLKAKLVTLRKEQTNSATTQVFNTADLDRQGKIYIQKVSNTIAKTKSELESKLRNAGYMDIEIKGVEDANGKIKSLTASVTDATGAFKQLNFERAKIQNQGKAQSGFIQTNDVKVIGNISSSIVTVQNHLNTLKSKWEEQGILVGEFKAKVDQLDSSLTTVGNKGELNGLKSQIEALKNEASTISKINKIQFQIETGGYESKVESLISRTRQWTDETGNARSSTDALSKAFENLKVASGALSNDNTVANQQALIAAEKELDVQIKSVTNSVKNMNATLAKDSTISSLHQRIQEFYDKNGAAHRQWGSQLKQMLAETSSGASLTNQRVREIESSFIQVGNAARQAGKLGKSGFQKFTEGMKSFSYWTSSTFLIMKGISEIRKAITFTRELDRAMTNINYTMDVSQARLESIGESALSTAKDLKTSASNVLSAITTYANANETAETILNKSKPTIMLSNVSGMDTATTTDIIQGTIHQFDLEDTEESLMHVSDVLQTVSQSMAVDFAKGIKEMAEGIQVSGSVAKDAGYDLENYSALLGNLIEKTRQSGSELGRSLRTMFVRTTKASTSALAGGEVTEDDLSNAETALRRIGIEVRKDIDSFRNFDDIMSDLYNKIDDLSEVDLANVAYEVASKIFVLECIVIYSVLNTEDRYIG